MANTTIIHKIGSGKPSTNQLKQGEIGIDPVAKVIWTYSEKDSDFVELSGGDVNWNQIDPESFPDEIINILYPDGNTNYVDLQALKAQVGANTGAIDALENVVGDANSGLVKQVNNLEGRVSSNETSISTNAGNIATNKSDIQGNVLAIGALEGRIDVNDGLISDNAEDIQRLEGLINNSLTGLVLGGEYDASKNKVVSTTTEGANAGLAVDSALPGPSESTKGIYVIVTVGGPLSGTGTRSPNREEDGTMAHKGDWLVSDGIHGWILFELGQQDVTFGMIGGSPDDNAALKAALESKIAVGDTIDCGQYT
jgi:hypothetical protein